MRREEEYAMLDGEITRLKAEVERLNGVVTRQREENDRLHKEVTDANLQVSAFRSVLGDAVRGHCPICGVGGDGSKQNHHEDCEARKLITESRICAPTQPCICGLSAARCPIHE